MTFADLPELKSLLNFLRRALQTFPRHGIGAKKPGLALFLRDPANAGLTPLGVSPQHRDFCAGQGQSLGHASAQNTGCANDHRNIFLEIKQIHGGRV